MGVQMSGLRFWILERCQRTVNLQSTSLRVSVCGFWMMQPKHISFRNDQKLYKEPLKASLLGESTTEKGPQKCCIGQCVACGALPLNLWGNLWATCMLLATMLRFLRNCAQWQKHILKHKWKDPKSQHALVQNLKKQATAPLQDWLSYT